MKLLPIVISAVWANNFAFPCETALLYYEYMLMPANMRSGILATVPLTEYWTVENAFRFIQQTVEFKYTGV